MLRLNSYSTLFIVLLLFATLNSCKKDKPIWCDVCQEDYKKLDESKSLTKIVFGSCASQLSPLPLLTTAANQNPDLFIFLGDNIYADTEDMDKMREKYLTQCAKSDFIKLKQTSPIMAVWDDHDFGYNDAGSEYKFKEESKQNFMEFWGETGNSARMGHTGNYDAKIIGETGKKVQIISLDTRTFRSALLATIPFNYEENFDANATILGAEQWAWLQTQLLKPADVRIIVSSIQFAVEHNGWEAWANFPLEQQKMYDLIASTQASGVVFISGDVHYSEFAKRTPSNTYPLYDLTSSGITGVSTPVSNAYRIGNAYNQNNIGKIDIDWNGAATNIKFTIMDVNATVLIEENVVLSDIQF